MQVGVSMSLPHVVTKSPNAYGANHLSTSPLAMVAKSHLVLAGNALAELAMAIGVLDAGVVATTPFNGKLPLREEAKDWCDTGFSVCAELFVVYQYLGLGLLDTPVLGTKSDIDNMNITFLIYSFSV